MDQRFSDFGKLGADCPICDRRGKTWNAGAPNLVAFQCTQCGKFEVNYLAFLPEVSPWELDQKVALSCATRQASEEKVHRDRIANMLELKSESS